MQRSLSVDEKLALFDLGKGRKVSFGTLTRLLPTIEVTLFFAKAYDLDARALGVLLKTLFDSSVFTALTEGSHSTQLQTYLLGLELEAEVLTGTRFDGSTPPAEFLPELWSMSELKVVSSIKEVAAQIGDILDHLPGKYGTMVFQHMARVNRLRPTIGTYEAGIKHHRNGSNLVILDVSGSMSERTVQIIVNDVVALALKADAHLAIVSNTCTMWLPGSFTTQDVLSRAEYSGTHYEQLAPILKQNWDTVITIADYDSSYAAKDRLSRSDIGRIKRVLDVSLVNRRTFLAECVGQNADLVESLMMANGDLCR